jgi:nucleoside-diphosphate-sugar epimerase
MKRLLVIGFGDIAHRTAALLPPAVEVRAVSRHLGGDLDRLETLPDSSTLLQDPEHAVLHCVPPPGEGTTDPRTAALLDLLEAGPILPSRIVYISTSGVYGDCGGDLVEETRAVNPQTPRAVRRVDAERQLLRWGDAHAVPVVILRAPGIYADNRLPIDRLRRGTPVLRDEDDVYTNHIHADDLAAITLAALDPAAPPGVYNASDDSHLKMGQWFDLVADRQGLPRPPRVSREQAMDAIPATMRSFMGESRRLDNTRMKEALGVRLKYPSVHEGVPRIRRAA